MIVKIDKQNLTVQIFTTNDPPIELDFFDAYDGGTDVYCFITDGMDSYLAVPFVVIPLPDPLLDTLPRMVGVEVLDAYGLPHGQPPNNGGN